MLMTRHIPVLAANLVHNPVFYIDAQLSPSDEAYEWILAFWEHSSAFKKRSRDFVIETGQKTRTKRGMHRAFGAGVQSMCVNDS